MTNYTIEKVENGIATVRYPDQSWAEIILSADMTEAELDARAYEFRPKTGVAPSFISSGQIRTASPATVEDVITEVVNPDWLQNRLDAYGSAASQLEYITENGLEAWQAHVAEIKAMYPKE